MKTLALLTIVAIAAISALTSSAEEAQTRKVNLSLPAQRASEVLNMKSPDKVPDEATREGDDRIKIESSRGLIQTLGSNIQRPVAAPVMPNLNVSVPTGR